MIKIRANEPPKFHSLKMKNYNNLAHSGTADQVRGYKIRNLVPEFKKLLSQI
jgi:hypothetical protein